MSTLKDVCRALLRTQQSNREIGRRLRWSATTVGRYRRRLLEESLDWPAVEALDDIALDRLLNPGKHHGKKQFVEPDWAHVHQELQRRGVTKALLHEEYALGLESGAM